jgi:pimeloyl-ACP methyl ester carboxylesterase
LFVVYCDARKEGIVERFVFDPMYSVIGLEREALMTAPELIVNEGYPFESHRVRTPDGFVLELHRIPYGQGNRDGIKRTPLLVFHPLALSSAIWVFNQAASPGFVFADAGFDVWLANFRGTSYSYHNDYDRSEPGFWEFTQEEAGTIDTPAMIDYILQHTGQEKLYTMAHVFGSWPLLIALSKRPEYNDKVKMFIGLCPHSSLHSIGKPVPGVFMSRTPYAKWLMDLQVRFTNGYLPLDSAVAKFVVRVGSHIESRVGLNLINKQILMMHAKFDSGCLNQTRFPVYFPHFPEYFPVKAISHFMQVMKTAKFSAYDWGREENLLRYGQETPEEYPLDKITIPVVMTHHDNDMGYNKESVEHLAGQMTSAKVNLYHVDDPTWCHLDYNFNSNGKVVLYDKLIEYVKTLDQQL